MGVILMETQYRSINVINAAKDDYEEVMRFYHSLIDSLNPEQCHVGWQKDVYPSPEFLRSSVENG
ncbi:MAG: hypothetical protein IKF06_07235, partial [Lachnospiraceae bacterium]|nr:hypothetical protein [Lachnospiraceae bacterium]